MTLLATHKQNLFRPWHWLGSCVITTAFSLLFYGTATPSLAASGTLEGDKQPSGEVALATLEWPPYTGESLPNQGAVSTIIMQAFGETNLKTRIAIWPWNRAIKYAGNGFDGVLGYFPGYHCHHDSTTKFLVSKPLIDAPLGFVYRKDHPLDYWQNLEDLKDRRIGYVSGYASTDAFEALEQSRKLTVIRTADDRQNLHNLLSKKVDLILIDRFVFHFLLASEQSFAHYKKNLGFSSKPLERKVLYLCLRDDELGRKLITVFNRGLAHVDARKVVTDYFSKAFAPLGKSRTDR